MPEWWTYTLSDFLLFSPRAYYRLIERHNQAVWPGQIAALGLGILLLVLSRRPTPVPGRLVSTVLALLWSWVAWGFVWNRYVTINWAAGYLVWIFAAEVLLLLAIGVVRGELRFCWRRDATGYLGLTLLIIALGLYPAFGPALGRGWAQAEVFGVAPDPTVLATLGLLLLAAEGPRRTLLIAPLAWTVVSGLTLWALGSPEAWLLLPAALLAGGVAARSGGRSPRSHPIRPDESS